ncbi:MAG TPA: glycosyltransferase [Thermoplasmata archaeon]|nr:glycosyltransferase [Thermoplasmata archaeon]
MLDGPWASWVAWLTVSVALTWLVAGIVLLVVGWLSLPRRKDPNAPAAGSRGGGRGVRIAGGIVAAVGAVAAASYLLAHGAPWESQLLGLPVVSVGGTLLGDLWAGFGWLGAGLATSPSWLPRIVGQFFAAVDARVSWLGGELRGAVGWITARADPVVAPASNAAWAGMLGLFWGTYGTLNLFALATAVAVGAFAGWMSGSSRWKFSGIVTYLGLDLLALGLIALSLLVVETSRSLWVDALGLWLVGVELFGFLLFLAYQFYTLEYIAGQGPRPDAVPAPIDDRWTPFVLVQVASFNEPVEIVARCLASVARLDYPRDRFAVQLLDDSTDRGTVAELEALCQRLGVAFLHRTHRRGFKGGALNDGLAAFPGRPDLIAIVDSDYVVTPAFLRTAVPPFRAPAVGFVQTPQAYRNAQRSAFARWYALADAYFYRVVQPVRARVQSLIFCGTMGLVRRSALRSAGGWSETCVTEDAELSLRLLALGWKGVYLPTTVGWGLAPDLMSAVRSQHRRWAFGGLQMLRSGRTDLRRARLTLRQRIDFRMGGLFWVDGLFLLGVTSALAALMLATWFGVTLRLSSIGALTLLALAPFLLMLDGIVKLRVALRTTTRVSYRDVFGVMAFWYAIKLNDLRAALRGWAGARLPFVRTPKTSGPRPSRASALRAAAAGSPLETVLASAMTGLTVATAYRWGLFDGRWPSFAGGILLGWGAYYAAAYYSALGFDYFSRRTTPAAPPARARAPTGPTPGAVGS